MSHTNSPPEPEKDVQIDALSIKIAPEEELLARRAVEAQWTTSRKELWAYYTYYIGDNGLSGFNFGPSQFQNLLYLAGWDQSDPTRQTACTGDSVCVLPFGGSTRDVNSIVLVTNGISFAIQAVLFLGIGAWADYGTWRPNILIAFTAVAVAVSFSWLGVEDPSKYQAGIALYIIGLITYQGTITFWTAAFPALARNLPPVQEARAKVAVGETTLEEYEVTESLARNMVQNIAFAIQSAGEIVVLAIMLGILAGLQPTSSTDANTRAFSVLISFSGAVWLLCALPWFVLEKRRPGNSLPPGVGMVTIGFVQTWVALRQCAKLKQTFTYLVFYFLMGDVLNTTVTVIGTLQNELVEYSTTQLTYLLLVGIVAQLIGIYAFWRVQKHFKISTKAMLLFNAIWILVLCAWGLVGIWTDRFGFKNVWEIWAYQAFYGLLVCPWYAYSQTFISEVIPHGKEFLFFALFSIIGTRRVTGGWTALITRRIGSGKTSAFIGPFVSSAIIDDANGNNSMPFAFLLALGAVSMFILLMVNVRKSRKECEDFLLAEARAEHLVIDA